MKSPIGAHIPVGGGLAKRGLSYADSVGAETVQVFVSSPRGWAQPPVDPAQDEEFRNGCTARKIPAFIHAPYLVNFGSPTEQTLENSARAMEFALRRGTDIGAIGVVVHAGSAVGTHRDDGLKRVREHLLPLLEGDGPRVLIEPTAGGGQALAGRIEQLADYFDVLDNHPRLGICLDTCHAFAAGHDLTARGGVRSLIRTVQAIGPLLLVHANDSKDPVGSGRDRHERVGAGTIGPDPFRKLLSLVRDVPVVVETPESGAAEDIALLKRLRG